MSAHEISVPETLASTDETIVRTLKGAGFVVGLTVGLGAVAYNYIPQWGEELATFYTALAVGEIAAFGAGMAKTLSRRS